MLGNVKKDKGNPPRLHYEDLKVNNVKGNTCCLLLQTYETHEHTVCIECKVFMLKQVVYRMFHYHMEYFTGWFLNIEVK
jgi:hypothetical protein